MIPDAAPGREPPVVLLNYHIDPHRRTRHFAAIAAELGESTYALVDASSPSDRSRVRILVNKTREVSAEMLAQFPRLKGICLNTTQDWMLSFDRTAFPLKVRGVETDRGTDVAEVAILLMLLGLKRLHELPRWHALRSASRMLRQLAPPRATETVGGHNWASARTLTVYRKRVGIIGYGLIGREIHRRLEGFGATVLYHATTRFSPAIEHRLRIEHREIPALFEECDVIFVQVPLTAATRGLIAQRELARAKPTLVLVNCGRAAVIDKPALASALRDRCIGFYGADVFWREPMPLWDGFRFLRNVRITPHFSESVLERSDHDRNVARALATLAREIDASPSAA